MDYSLASNPLIKPLDRPPTVFAELASLKVTERALRGGDIHATAELRDKVIVATDAMSTQLVLDPKALSEQTLKPYGTLMLPYRGDGARVSVLV